jgi:hypothetical protein
MSYWDSSVCVRFVQKFGQPKKLWNGALRGCLTQTPKQWQRWGQNRTELRISEVRSIIFVSFCTAANPKSTIFSYPDYNWL